MAAGDGRDDQRQAGELQADDERGFGALRVVHEPAFDFSAGAAG